MTESTENSNFERLVQSMDPENKLLRAWAMKGGFSAQVTALEVERPDGQTLKLIVHQHGAANLKNNPQIAAHEFRLLKILHSLGLATPKPYYIDQSGEILSTPLVVLEYVDGLTEFAPANLDDCLLQLSTHLSRIHNVDCINNDLTFLQEQAKIYADKFRARPEKLDDSLSEGRIRDTLEAVWPLLQQNKSALLHGDYWPGNVLWKDGQLVAVIDWEIAELGDPLADLGNTRLEILWAFGIEAMRRFTDYYEAMNPIDFSNLPYWDLCAALRPAGKIAEWAADVNHEKLMRDRHRLFIARAFDNLPIR